MYGRVLLRGRAHLPLLPFPGFAGVLRDNEYSLVGEIWFLHLNVQNKLWKIRRHYVVFTTFPFSDRSISSASSSDIPSKCPSVPPPDYSPGPSITPQKPNQQYRRGAHGRHGDFKYGGQSYNAKVVVNGHIQHERALKKSQDERDSAKVTFIDLQRK